MKLITGGAYSGKRNYVRSLSADSQFGWLSGYETDHDLEQWRTRWLTCDKLVLEGWECWIEKKLEKGVAGHELEQWLRKIVDDIMKEERKYADNAKRNNATNHKEAYLIMLEMGRGIVPANPNSRILRDICGRLSQEVARQADEVIYMWHGLPHVLSRNIIKEL